MLPTGHGWLAGLFYFFVAMGAPGLFLLGVLDSSFLMLPFANDLAVVVLVSLHHDRLLMYIVAAMLGSVAGCWIMYWVGRAGGESFIRAHVRPQRFKRIVDSVKHKGPVLLAVPALIPPPFPFSAFVLGAGALEVPQRPFLSMLAAMRFLRFLAEGLAALYFGRRIIVWMKTPFFQHFIQGLMGIAILASAYSIFRLARTSRGRRPAVAQKGTK